VGIYDPKKQEPYISRRALLKGTAVTAAGMAAAGVAGYSIAVWDGRGPSESAAGQEGTEHAEMSNDEMDAAAEAVVKAFPAATEGVGGVPLEYRMENGVRVFDLVCQDVDWEVTPGKKLAAHTYNGIVPGPEIRVVEGEPVRVVVKNDMEQSTSVHWHGQRVPNPMDGVPFITQPPIKPGETFVYEFTPGPFGSHMYHSHHNATEQVGKGMLGALIVDPQDKSLEPSYDIDYTLIMNDALGGFTINGKGFPATAPIVANAGQRVRIRFMNEGQMVHPFHLHGLTYEIFARDGYLLPQPFRCDTINVAPGERWDAIVVADNPGIWAFHCHILSHVEGPMGMFGMVTALIVE
jgi:FtsP/CotA-like multicopper oxidase with cupredoxin domain